MVKFEKLKFRKEYLLKISGRALVLLHDSSLSCLVIGHVRNLALAMVAIECLHVRLLSR